MSFILICGFGAAVCAERATAAERGVVGAHDSKPVLAVALPLQRAPWARGCFVLSEIVSAMERLESDYVLVDDQHVAALSGAGSGNSMIFSQMPRLPATTSILETLSLLRRADSPVGLVLDEFGAARWFVTLDEVLEQTLFDSGKLEVSQAQHSLEVDGWVTIERLVRMGFALPRGEWRSVGGLLSAKAERVPEAGYSIELHPYRVTVKTATHRAVTRVVLETVA